MDSRLPGGALPLGALHEIAGGGNGAIDGAAAALFAAGIAARTRGKVLWCLTRLDLFAPAVAQAGLNSDRVIYLEGGDEKTILACFEEGLRHGGLGAVVGEVARLPMTASRRLQLAAEGSGTIGIALRRWRRQTEASDFGQPTAATTLWRVSALPSTPLPVPGVGRPRWLVELIRCRESAGLRVGMPATKAQALVQGLVIQDANPIADAEALDRLAFWMLQRFAPIVAADPPNGIVIDSTGADHLHGGEGATLAILVEKLASVGLRSRAAIADTWGAAHVLARFDARPGFVSAPGNAARDVAPLSISALRLASDMVRDLRVLGFDRVGDVLAQPRAPLALRFGPELGRRLDQATGRLAEPIEPIRPEALIEVRRAFAEPIGAAQTVARTIGKLATQLCDALERRGLGVGFQEVVHSV